MGWACVAEHCGAERFEEVVEGLGPAEDAQRLGQAAHQREGWKGEVPGGELVPGVGVGAQLAADGAQPALLVGRELVVAPKNPGLEAGAGLGLLLLIRFCEDQVAVFIDRHPGTGGWVDVVVDIERQQLARFTVRSWLSLHDDAALARRFVVAVEVGDADEVEHREDRLALGLAGAAPAHLLVQDRRPG